MQRSEITRFIRTMAYINIFTAPFQAHSTAAASLFWVAVLLATD